MGLRFCFFISRWYLQQTSLSLSIDTSPLPTVTMRNLIASTGKISLSTSPSTAQTSQAVYMTRTKICGTLTAWGRSWIASMKIIGSRLKGSTQLTCTLACGRPLSHGTQKTWTCTALTTYTLAPQSPGMPFLPSMGEGWRGWQKVTYLHFVVCK